MTELKRETKWYFFGGLLAQAVTISWVACSTSTPPLPALTPAQTVSKGTVESSIRGQGLAFHLSDVSTIPDFVITEGEVLFVPKEHAEDLAEMAGFDPSKMNYMSKWNYIQKMEYMSHAYFQLDESQFAKLAGAAAVIGADGRFPLDIPAGPYFVCLADSLSTGQTAGPPYSVGGCALIDLPNDASLAVSAGEGGVQGTLE